MTVRSGRDQGRSRDIGSARGSWVGGAVPERVAARELVEGSVKPDLLVDDLNLKDARIRRLLVECGGEGRAVHHVPVSVRVIVP